MNSAPQACKKIHSRLDVNHKNQAGQLELYIYMVIAYLSAFLAKYR